jgi:hypothetical protein
MWIVLEQFAYLLTRVVATALSVMGITFAAERFGSAIGGALSGLPIVVGPAMFFLYRDFGGEFTSDAAASSLMSLSATQVFLMVYCLAAARGTARGALSAASSTWFAAVFLLSLLPQSPAIGLLLFVVAAVCARLAVRRIAGARDTERARKPLSLRIVGARSIAAGLLVAVATLAAGHLGSDWSGIIAAYPIGFSFVVLTLHLRLGQRTAIATSYAAMLGLSSLAAFTFALSVALPVMAAREAFALALAAGMVTTGMACWTAGRAL